MVRFARVQATSVSMALGAVAVLVLVPAAASSAAPARPKRPVARVGLKEQQRIELGRRLFFEPTLTFGAERSCASCHDPEHGFSDPLPFSEDDAGPTPRHSQALIDVDVSMPLHWDGGVKDLKEIVRRRMSPPQGSAYYSGGSFSSSRAAEEALAIARRVREDLGDGVSVGGWPVLSGGTGSNGPVLSLLIPEAVHEHHPHAYGEAFDAVGGRNMDAPVEAVVAYVASLRSGVSAYDRFLAGEEAALGPDARRGLDLFQGRGRCAECHRLEPKDGWPSLRDGGWHNTGIAWLDRRTTGGAAGGGRFSGLPARIRALLPPALSAGPDPGRGGVVKGDAYVRAFKTPTLRDVALHPPYMHDGSLATLADVVRHYAEGCGEDPDRDARLRDGFAASDAEREDLVAFLRALTSDERPGLPAKAWAARASRTRVTLRDARGGPLAHVGVTLMPAGDLAARGAERGAPRLVTTDETGTFEFAPGSTTHLRLVLPRGLEVGRELWIPDTCRREEIRLPVLGRVRLALVLPEGLAPPGVLRLYPLGTGLDVGANPLPSTCVEGPAVEFVEHGVVDLGTRTACLYEGWLSTRHAARALFRLPGQASPQEVTLATGSPVRVDVRVP